MADPTRVDPVSRRTVLKGIVGAAGLVSIPAIIAACGSSTGSAGASAPAATSAATSGTSAAPSASAAGSAATGSLTLGSNASDPTPKKAIQAVVDAFTAATGITVKVNTVDHGSFQDNLSQYLQATPDDVITWFSGHRMRFFANQGLFTPIDDVWATVKGNFTPAMAAAATNTDGKVYLIPFDTYAWTVYYRKSVWADKGYQVPTTLDEFKTLAAKMKIVTE